MPKAELCPLCRKTTDPLYTPFCSQGCKDRDLLNWLGEAYRLPTSVHEAEDEDSALDRDPEA
jgi:uncharacterized protein